MEIPRNHGHKPNLKRNQFKFLNLGPSEQSVPKLPHFPNPYFGTEIWYSDGASPEISYIYRRACQISNPSDTRFQSYRAPYIWSQKWASTKNPLCHAPDPDFIGGFCSCGGSDQILKISQKVIKQISCESASKFGAQKFNGPKKENLGLKKNLNGWRRYSYFFYFRKKNFRPGLRPVFSNTGTIGLMFFLIVLVYIGLV